MRGTVWRAGAMAAALGLGAAGGAAAQGGGPRGPDGGWVALGVSRIDTGALDARLAAGGHPTFGRAARAPAVGAYWRLPGGAMLGGEWHGLVLGAQAHEGREVGLGGGYATLGAGYAVELSPRARVYPRLGLGAGGMGLWIEREAEAAGFDEVLADPDRRGEPARETVLSRAGAVVDLGAGAELRPGGRLPRIGVRLGYLAAPFGWRWSLSGAPVRDAPAASIAGPYLRLTLGAAR